MLLSTTAGTLSLLTGGRLAVKKGKQDKKGPKMMVMTRFASLAVCCANCTRCWLRAAGDEHSDIRAWMDENSKGVVRQ